MYKILIMPFTKANLPYLGAGVDVAGYPCEPLVGAVHRDLGVAPDARALPRALGPRQDDDRRQQERHHQGRRRRHLPSTSVKGGAERTAIDQTSAFLLSAENEG